MTMYTWFGKDVESEVWLPHSKEGVRAYLGVLRDAGQREHDKHKGLV